MEQKIKPQIFNILVFLIVLTAIPPALAESDYKLAWSTIDSGGGTSNGGTYRVSGTIGQPDAGYMYGGSYEILSGFWTGEPLCVVNLEDYAKFSEYWLATGSDLPADLGKDGDNVVNHLDLEIFIAEWLKYCPPDWPL